MESKKILKIWTKVVSKHSWRDEYLVIDSIRDFWSTVTYKSWWNTIFENMMRFPSEEEIEKYYK